MEDSSLLHHHRSSSKGQRVLNVILTLGVIASLILSILLATGVIREKEKSNPANNENNYYYYTSTNAPIGTASYGASVMVTSEYYPILEFSDTVSIIGSHGLPVVFIVYGDKIDIYACADPGCKNFNLSSSVNTGAYAGVESIIVGSDGLIIVPYFDLFYSSDTGTFNQSALKVIHCETANCSTTTVNSVDSQPFVGWFSTIHIASDGFPLISYMDNTESFVKIAHCADVACKLPATINNVTSFTESVGAVNSVIGMDGNPILLITAQNANLLSVHCLDLMCTNVEPYSVIGTIGDNVTTPVFVGNLGTIHIVVPGSVLTCLNDQCSNVSSVPIPVAFSHFALAATIDITGYPVIAAQTNGNVTLMICGNEDCSVNVIRVIENPNPSNNTSFYYHSLEIITGPSGYPLLTLIGGSTDIETSQVLIVSCANHLCTSWKN